MEIFETPPDQGMDLLEVLTLPFGDPVQLSPDCVEQEERDEKEGEEEGGHMCNLLSIRK